MIQLFSGFNYIKKWSWLTKIFAAMTVILFLTSLGGAYAWYMEQNNRQQETTEYASEKVQLASKFDVLP